jgi:hypothetical protein
MSRLPLSIVMLAAGTLVLSTAAEAQRRPPVPPVRRPPTEAAPVVKDTAAKDSATAVVPSLPLGAVFGTVYDSVHHAALVGAMVSVDGTTRHAFTRAPFASTRSRPGAIRCAWDTSCSIR